MFTLPRAAGFAAALCTALALSTPAFALDVQIQEGAAVKFPKGLKGAPMVKTETILVGEKSKIISHPTGKVSKNEQSLTLSVWKKELSLPFFSDDRPAEIVSKLIKLGKDFYFITAGDNNDASCKRYDTSTREVTYCKAKIIISNNAKLTSPVTIDAGTICKETGADHEYGGVTDPYEDLHPEIAFDEKNNTIYLRQKAFDHDIKECYRKITLIP